jgi:hypothetical protein
LTAGASTAAGAAGNIGASQINNFLNPYTNAVNRNLETNTAQNINQSILPALQAMGASSGSTGSQRLMNATGQTLGGIQQGLGAQESANMSQAYKDAVTQALQQQQNQGQIAGIQGQLGTGLENATVSGLNAGASLGAQGQAQNQALINAPLTTAGNVAQLLKGYTVPTGTTQTYSGPASSYGASPLAQIAGLGTLFASGANGTSAIDGLMKTFGISDPLKSMTDFNKSVGQNVVGTSTPTNTSSLGGYSNVTGNQVTKNENGEYVDVKTGEPVSFFE